MDAKQLDRFIELYEKPVCDMTAQEFTDYGLLIRENGYNVESILITELLRLREAGNKKDAMIYEMAETIYGEYASKTPDWIKAIANCPHPESPAHVAEAVKAALWVKATDEAEDADGHNA